MSCCSKCLTLRNESKIFSGIGGDKRIEKSLYLLLNILIESRCAIINRACSCFNEIIRAYRVLNNDRYTWDSLIPCLADYTAGAVEQKGTGNVLLIQDTTEFNYQKHSGRLTPNDPDLGKGSTHFLMKSVFCHPAIALDANDYSLLGVAALEVFNREESLKKPADRHKRALEEKEDYRWVETAIYAASVIHEAVVKTMVCDREGDAYEIMLGIIRAGCHFIIRQRSDRVLQYHGGQKVTQLMNSLPVAGEYLFKVGSSDKRSAHEARMELSFTKLRINPFGGDGELGIWCVMAREHPDTVPYGEEPIVWRLYTTHPVEDAGQARQIVEWYRQRWVIEEFFRTLKSEGFRLESAQLERGKSLKKLIIICMQAAIIIMKLKHAFDNAVEDVPAEDLLSDRCVEELKRQDKAYESEPNRNKGNTNPFTKGSLAWAAWLIARLGGWKGYISQGPPGRITISRGYKRLLTMIGYLDKFYPEDVYKE